MQLSCNNIWELVTMVTVLVQDATSVCIRMDMYVHAWQDRNYAITGQWDSHHNIQPLYDMYTAYDVHILTPRPTNPVAPVSLSLIQACEVPHGGLI